MVAQICPNRLEVNDRFPMLGFTIRTDGTPQFAEIAVATDLALFHPEHKEQRTPRNFFSSRASGPLSIPRGEAVYVLPSEVLARFIGADKLFVAMATSPESNGTIPRVDVLPGEGSPYISLKGLTGRSLKRVRLLPSRQQWAAGHGTYSQVALEWAGDAAVPGLQKVVSAAPGQPAAAPSSPSEHHDYDDGFGPMPAPEKPVASNPSAQSLGQAQWSPAGAGEFPNTVKVWAHAQEVIAPFYDPADPASALTCQNDVFSSAREEWFVGVPNTTIFPHSAICQLNMVDAAGNGYSGTGFYIGFNRILTCAHNLHSMTSVTIIPGKNGSNEPYGRCTLNASSWRISNRYPSDGSDFDLAVIDNVPIVAPGGQWFEFFNATPSDRLSIVVCGYSAQSDAVPELTKAIDGDMQHLHGGYVAEQSNLEVMEYPILTLHGASGAPVYHIDDSRTPLRALVCGVHVSGEPAARGLNRACFITPSKIDWIEGRTTALSLGSRTLEIPLDPGMGGRSIVVDVLQPADIIVSTARHAVSYAIRAGTFSAISHAMLYVGNGMVIEAVGSGVREVPIEQAIGDAILAVAYRDCRVNASIAQTIVDYASSRVGNPYNYAGVAFTGYRILNPLTARIIDGIASRLGLEVGQVGATYCSELVMEAFENAGVPLVASRPATSTPDDLVQLSRSVLTYVGHLKAEDVLLGIPLGLGYPGPVSLGVSNVMEGDVPVLNGDEVLMPEPPRPRARAMMVGEAAVAIGGFLLETVRDSSGDVTWELDQFAHVKHPNDTAPANPAPYRDAATIKLDQWPVSGGVADDISAWFAIDWQYNGLSLGNVRISNIGTNDAVGWSLHVRAQIMDDNILYDPGGCAALRICFHYRFSRVIGADNIAMTDIHLYGDGTWESSSQWVQSTMLGTESKVAGALPSRPMDVGTVASVIGTAISLVGGQAVVNPSWLQTWHPNGVAPPGQREWKQARLELQNVPWATGPVDMMTASFTITWEYDGLSVRNIFFYPNVNTAMLSDIEVSVHVIPRDARAANVFVPNSPLVAVVELQFNYRFIHKVDEDEIAVHRATIWGDGGSWQNPEPEWIKGGYEYGPGFPLPGGVRPGGRRSIYQ